MFAVFNRFELQLTRDQALTGSHQGSCDEDIKALLTLPAIKRQFKKIDPEKVKEELKEYGAWDDTELSNVEDNQARILWIACGDIREENKIRTRKLVHDLSVR